MTESSNLPNRVDRLENDTIDLKVAVSALISTTEVHQRNIETMNRNIETMNRNIETMNRNMEIHQRNMEATNRNVDGMLQLMTAIQKLDKSRHLLLTSSGAWERLSLGKLSRFSQP
ncbi:hypothetical protein [Microcoleus sp. CAWBG58]|uniref:hypothetical protein n=1 Tax=Microcoleus sp. CAWBG58 TaxID=2841651 RepID=UPI0025DBFDF3|nr:hypothetical protein [Microcoleus sp. CAWBG58]